MPVKTHYYSNGEITVAWRPDVCVHSGICFKGLAAVFDPRRRPWIDMSQADSQRIVEQVKKCLSGALGIADKEAVKRASPLPGYTFVVIL